MTCRLVDYWSGVSGHELIHPADQTVLTGMKHKLKTALSPNPFFGPLASAPIVLLFLNPGLRQYDTERAGLPETHNFFHRQRSGCAPLPSSDEYEPTHSWLSKILRQFDLNIDAVREQVAVVNLCPYRSETFQDYHMLAALPSCRATLDWAQNTLFPQAEADERVVVCLRAAKHWGLKDGFEKGSLFAPTVTRGGFMYRGDFRDRVVGAVRMKLCLPPIAST